MIEHTINVDPIAGFWMSLALLLAWCAGCFTVAVIYTDGKFLAYKTAQIKALELATLEELRRELERRA